ncbi:hypothetical protein V2H29_20655, partial [Lysinibacillus fusiformis]|uniref:hypothetical protein n=1 Tax=Lysinibacillus fusiformis TaxID=28031 RepID=UPI002E9CFDF0|nr:hypothetical protein [Lysinibacillus fusiformis]
KQLDPARGKRPPVVEINGFTLFHCKRKKTVGKLKIHRVCLQSVLSSTFGGQHFFMLLKKGDVNGRKSYFERRGGDFRSASVR